MENITVEFDNTVIIEDFNLHIADGEHICFWGPSGSGKTSILKLIMGIILPAKGKIYYQNKIVDENNIADLRKQIAWIPQNINLSSKSGRELSDFLNIRSDKFDAIYDKLPTLGLDSSYFDRNFNEISIGQKQRVIIAIALSMSKKILLLDEPTSALDGESVAMMIKSVLSDKSTSVISASHDHIWAEANERLIKINSK
jgi:ABC-type Mn2+/Zn2+ transport system ATPase subunit